MNNSFIIHFQSYFSSFFLNNCFIKAFIMILAFNGVINLDLLKNQQ